MAICSRFEKIKCLQIFSCSDGDYAIVTYMNPLNLPWLSLGQKLEKVGAISPWILRSGEHQLEMIEGSFIPNPLHNEKSTVAFHAAIPELIDDVLLHLMKFLNANDLAAVARSSKRFKCLAYNEFARSGHKLRIDGDSFVKNRALVDMAALIEFGPITQHLELDQTSDVVAFSIMRTVFQYVVRNKLKSLRFCCRVIINKKTNIMTFMESLIVSLPALEILDLESNPIQFIDYKYNSMLFADLGKLCPKLKVLRLYGSHMSVKSGFDGFRPSLQVLRVVGCWLSPLEIEWLFWASADLREIECIYSKHLNLDNIIEYALKYNLNKKIGKITFKQDEDYSINTNLSLFSNLEFIHLGGSLICDLDTADALSKVTTIKSIEIINKRQSKPLKHKGFLEMLALKMPQLKLFKITGYTVPICDIGLFKSLLPGCHIRHIILEPTRMHARN